MIDFRTPFVLSLLFPVALLAQAPDVPKVPIPSAVEPVEAPAEPVLADDLVARIRSEGIEHSHVMAYLRDLTGNVGHRLTGSDNFTKACDWAVAQFKAMGIDNAHKEKWGEWNLVWNRGKWEGRIVSPVQLDMYVATEAWTASTNGRRRVRVVTAPKDAEGVAALRQELGTGIGAAYLYYDKRPPAAVRKELEAAGIGGWVYKAVGDAKYPTRVRVFGDHRIAQRQLADVPTIPSIAVRSDHAEQLEQLLADGKEVVCEFLIESEFRKGPIELDNVIAEIPGTVHPDEVVIVCGHLDSWHQAQGCTDNGTGTTSTIEAARILAKVGAKPDRTIRFCLWGGEEEGLLGSTKYVQMHRTEMDKVAAVFNHDTGTNYAAGLTVSDAMYDAMRRVIAPVLAMPVPDADAKGPGFVLKHAPTISGGGGSDHASFIAAGVPGLNWNLKGRSDYFGYTWHSQWDTIDVAIEEYQRHTSTVIALAALGTANLPAQLDRSGVVRGGGGQAARIVQAVFQAEMDGMKFSSLEKDGRGARMGIQAGDVLIRANGEDLTEVYELLQVQRDLEADAKTMDLELKRGAATVKIQVDLQEFRNAAGRRGRGRGGDGGDGARGDGARGDGARGDSSGGDHGAAPAGSAPAGAGSTRRGGEREPLLLR